MISPWLMDPMTEMFGEVLKLLMLSRGKNLLFSNPRLVYFLDHHQTHLGLMAAKPEPVNLWDSHKASD